MNVVFLSYSLDANTPHYGGASQGLLVDGIKRIDRGDTANVQQWTLQNHAGTHIDAPRHFFEQGASADSYPAGFWVCREVAIVECLLPEGRLLAPSDVEGRIARDAECVLIKTGYGLRRHLPEYINDAPGLSPELCTYLRREYPDLRFVGFDFISVTRLGDRPAGRAAHRILLDPEAPGSPLLPIEDMDLSSISVGRRVRRMVISPLRVAGADGAPVTIVAEIE